MGTYRTKKKSASSKKALSRKGVLEELKKLLGKASKTGTARSVKKPVKKTVAVRKPVRKPVKKAATVRKPVRKPVKKAATVRKPVKKVVAVRKPVRKPVKKAAAVRKPVKKAATVRKPVKKVSAVRKPVKKAVAVRKPVRKPVKKASAVQKPVKKAAVEKLKALIETESKSEEERRLARARARAEAEARALEMFQDALEDAIKKKKLTPPKPDGVESTKRTAGRRITLKINDYLRLVDVEDIMYRARNATQKLVRKPKILRSAWLAFLSLSILGDSMIGYGQRVVSEKDGVKFSETFQSTGLHNTPEGMLSSLEDTLSDLVYESRTMVFLHHIEIRNYRYIQTSGK